MARAAASGRSRKHARAAEPQIVRLSTKGQLTIPHEWRSRHQLAAGSPLAISEDEEGRLVLAPLPPDWLNPTPELQALIQGVQQEMKRRNVTADEILAELSAVRQKP